MLVDVTPLGVTGKEAEHLLDEIGITVNKNGIPFDQHRRTRRRASALGHAGHHVARLRRRTRCGPDRAGSSSRPSGAATTPRRRAGWRARSREIVRALPGARASRRRDGMNTA